METEDNELETSEVQEEVEPEQIVEEEASSPANEDEGAGNNYFILIKSIGTEKGK